MLKVPRPNSIFEFEFLKIAISTFWDGDRLESFLNGLQAASDDESEEIILPSEPYQRKRKEPVEDAKKEDPVDRHLMALGFGSTHWVQSVEWLGYH